MHVSSFSRCPSSAPAEVTAVLDRFWQIVSGQREQQFTFVPQGPMPGPFLFPACPSRRLWIPSTGDLGSSSEQYNRRLFHVPHRTRHAAVIVRAGTRGIPWILARLHSCESTLATLQTKHLGSRLEKASPLPSSTRGSVRPGPISVDDQSSHSEEEDISHASR
jgi:hypothetical protein